jgi:membrane protease YdiL (CAAX protease family)
MTTIKKFINAYPVLTYFALTFIFTWGCMALAVYPAGFPITGEQFETSGALVYLAMLAGPGGAGILLTGLLDGRAGFGVLLHRLIKWRVNVRWYAVALMTAPLLISMILLGLSLFSAEFQPAIFTAGIAPNALISAVAVGLVVGFFEEIGWTGFAVPRLRLRNGILNTGLIVGIVWGAWHFLPFWESDTFSGYIPLFLLILRLFAWLPPYRVLMVWVYDHTESLLVSVLMHASLVASLTIFVPAELTGKTIMIWILAWAAALWIVVAAVAITNGWRFSRQSSQRRMA